MLAGLAAWPSTCCSSRASTTIRRSWSTSRRSRCSGGLPTVRRRGRARGWRSLRSIGFLLRHDHGVFVALAMGTLILLLRAVVVRAAQARAALCGDRRAAARALPRLHPAQWRRRVLLPSRLRRGPSATATAHRWCGPVSSTTPMACRISPGWGTRSSGPWHPARQQRGVALLPRDRAAGARDAAPRVVAGRLPPRLDARQGQARDGGGAGARARRGLPAQPARGAPGRSVRADGGARRLARGSDAEGPGLRRGVGARGRPVRVAGASDGAARCRGGRGRAVGGLRAGICTGGSTRRR